MRADINNAKFVSYKLRVP